MNNYSEVISGFITGFTSSIIFNPLDKLIYISTIKNIPIIAINHVYAAMSFMGGNVIAGGGGPAYNSSITLTFSKAQEKVTDGSITGGLITSTTTKCRTAKEKTKIKNISCSPLLSSDSPMAITK